MHDGIAVGTGSVGTAVGGEDLMPCVTEDALPTSLSLADYADQIIAPTDAALDSSPPPPSGGIEEGSTEEDVADSSGGGRGRRLSPAATFTAVITATACNVEGDCSSAASKKKCCAHKTAAYGSQGARA